jgi:undecaprenyl-phosphate galactose phosphotransferase
LKEHVSGSKTERLLDLPLPEPTQMRALGTMDCVLAREHGTDPAPPASSAPVIQLPRGRFPQTTGIARISPAYDVARHGIAPKKPFARAAKMAIDVGLAGSALVVLAPVMLLIACAVRCDGGAALFAHARIGRNGQVFYCLKFRSMVVDSDAALQRLFATDPAAREEWLRTHKLRRDPRVTWIGRILRKTSLDELPQLLNVLRLDMSLVGPRPIVSAEVPKYGADIAYYYATRPGITGLWQVSGRSDTTYAHRVSLDTSYVRDWTLWRDISILIRTIPAVLSGRGAG